ncbi:uncharacterized protein LOC102195188 isoform X2 [Pundamilia nyererei]|uniref:Uncharacterized protein LOC102195188 isoform X2 n=1 Tax=Pundamilia nyererei TaxID=303518 RepID=A0A9Y3R076_9CICH|nr:PREDICTED: uncharacterized protein LOC102195188 isoform X2 [Pundamilia nyererei]
MKKIFSRKKKIRMSEGKKPLIENNNNIQDGHDCAGHEYENPLAQNSFNSAEEQSMQRQQSSSLMDLIQCLGVSSESLYNLIEANLGQQSVIAWSNPQTFNILNKMLQEIKSVKQCLQLMDWVQHKYLREVLFSSDQKLFCEWKDKAKEKLLQSVQKEIRESLDKILQNETGIAPNCIEEDYVKLYVDTIQCINAVPREAQKLLPELHDEVQEICFQEFRTFVKRYSEEQYVDLKKRAQTDNPETIHFLKTLKTCKELRKYAQTIGTGVTPSLVKETVETLENLEQSTLTFLMEIITVIAENHFKDFFRSGSNLNHFVYSVYSHFPTLPYVMDEKKEVVDEAYKIIARTYVEHLITNKRRTLKGRWAPNIGEQIHEDANHLHKSVSLLAPGVHEWRKMMLGIQEVLDCTSIDALKIIMARLQRDYFRKSEDFKFLNKLLKWKGLSNGDVNEVLDALPGSESRPICRSCFSCLTCW